MHTRINVLTKAQQNRRADITKWAVDNDKILYLTGSSNYTDFHLNNGQTIIMSVTMLRYEERLPEFIRVHKQVLINPAYVIEFINSNTLKGYNFVKMKDGKIFEIARRRINEVDKKLASYGIKSSKNHAL